MLKLLIEKIKKIIFKREVKKMAKKSVKALNFLYLIGMCLTAIGFCCPLFFRKGMGGKIIAGSMTGFNFINFDNFGKKILGSYAQTWCTLAALMIFAGALLGVLFSFLKLKKINLLKLLALAITIVGGVIFIFLYRKTGLGSNITGAIFKHAFVGLYLIVIGWVAAIVGYITK